MKPNRIFHMLLLLLLALAAIPAFSCGDDDDDDQAADDDSDDDDTADDDTADDDDDDDDDDFPEHPQFYEDYPFCLDRSSWSGFVDASNLPRPRKLGGFGMGNGRVFAMTGCTYPLQTLHNIIGPDYDREIMFFSDKRFWLHKDGQKISFSKQWDFRVRKTPIVLTRSLGQDIEMHTVDFAPLGAESKGDPVEQSLIRIVIVRNLGNAAVSGLELVVHSTRGLVKNGVLYEAASFKDLQMKPFGFEASGTWDMKIALPKLEPGGEIVVPLVFAFKYRGEDAEPIFEAIRDAGVEALLENTYNRWSEWYGRSARIITPDVRFNDLMEGLQVTIKSQQAFTGAICVMSEYTLTWIRDTTGPALFYAPLGRIEDYKQMLDYFYLACLVEGGLGNSQPSNIEVEEWPPDLDWENMGIMGGRTRAESPSYIPLQYALYYRHTGDLATIAERYGMMKHCVVHLQVHEGCLLTFSGDETFRDIMGTGFGYLIGGTAYEDLFYSANSMFLFVAAAEVMVGFADLLGYEEDRALFQQLADDFRDCIDQYFWLEEDGFFAPIIDIDTLEPVRRPFEDVNTKPLFVGYASPDDPKARENLLSTMDIIDGFDGTLQTPLAPMYQFFPHIKDGVLTGMSHWYYLDNLSRMDHPIAEKAFMLYEVHPTESGNMNEGHVRDDYGRLILIYEPMGFFADSTSRFRPWEGGICGASLLRYLAGFDLNLPEGRVSLAPHLPAEWDSFTFENAPYGDHSFDLVVSETTRGARTIELINGGGSFDLTCKISVPGQIQSLVIDGETHDPGDYDLEWEWGLGRVTIDGFSVKPNGIHTFGVNYSK